MRDKKILYLTNVPIPKNKETDAHFQELTLLSSNFSGELISTFPLSRPNSLFPRSLYGAHNRFEIKRAAKKADLIHIFSPVLHPFPYIRRLSKKPVIFSTLTPVLNPIKIKGISHFIVYDQPSLLKLQNAGIQRVALSPPYVDFAQDHTHPPEGKFNILMASAPWEKSQFESKGVYLLMEMLGRFPQLCITFIWRDILFEDMQKLVNLSPFADRITLINERVDIGDYLKKAHAVILIAKYASLVKSYPHSLMEGLLSGRPIITSPTIPMSEMIKTHNYGQVISCFNADALEYSISSLIAAYESHGKAVKSMPSDRFSKSNFLAFYQNFYQLVLSD